MDFQRLLLEVGKALSKDEVKALAFLCVDLLGRNPASVESASDLFSRLANQDRLSPEEPHLLMELLSIIQRTRLARDLGLADQAPVTVISPYRKLLYHLSEDLTEQDLKDVKFLLNKKLPRRKLEENVSALEVFLEMEHMDLITDTHLDLLEIIIQQVCPMLKEKINHYKAQQSRPISLVAQETCRPRSQSCPFETSQARQDETVFGETLVDGGRHTHSLEKQQEYQHGSKAMHCCGQGMQPLAESHMNSSNTSMDHPNMFRVGDEREELLNEMRRLNTGKNTSEVRSDATVFSPTGGLTSTTNTNTEVLGTYPMTAPKRGVCLIINNYDFTESKGSLLKREGTMVDEVCLQKVFEWLGFEVEILRDCTSERMLSAMHELGDRSHSQMDCLVCCFLSHGLEGSVYGVDGRTVNIRDLLEPVNGSSCFSLAEKPKLFFIQACQGTKEQRPVFVESDGPARRLVCSDAIEARDSIPSDAHFLLGMATVPSFVSYRERSKGTWFIQTLCKNLVEMVPRSIDLVSILTKVNADVSQKSFSYQASQGVKKQMPQPAFTLTKKVVFPVPEAFPPNL